MSLFFAIVLAVCVASVPAEEPAAAPNPSSGSGCVYVPGDGKPFDISDKDTVRFSGPSAGSTGVKTVVKVVHGDATVTERPVYSVVKGKVIRIGGGAPEFDVRPKPGKKGTVKVTVTTTPAGGGDSEVKHYEFEVK